MADNPSPQPPPKGIPLQQSSGTTGKLTAPTTRLPGKTPAPGKIVVMLSSVAKPPPGVTQSIPMVAPPLRPPTNVAQSNAGQIVRQPAPLPPKQVTPAAQPSEESGRLSSTTFVKLPPKTPAPGWSLAATKPMTEKTAPPLLPLKRSEPVAGPVKKAGPQNIPAIKLNEASSDAPEGDSILLQPGTTPAKPPALPDGGWKSLEKGELNPPPGGLENLEAFARSQKLADKPSSPDSETKPTPPASVVPPLIAPPAVVEPKQALNPAPVALTPAHAVHVAPPMKESESAPETPSEKLPPPHLPPEAKKSETDAPSSPLKAPALVPSEIPSTAPAKPLAPPVKPGSKAIDERKKSTPIVVTSTPPKLPGAAEAKPALRPAVLPKRSVATPSETETPLSVPPLPVEAKKSEVPPAIPSAVASESKPEEKKVEIAALASARTAAAVAAKSLEAEKKSSPQAAAPLPTAEPSVPLPDAKKPALPPTRTERAKRRKLTSILIFWLVMVPLTGIGLVAGSLYFGRDTRVEGQIIPPAGMTVNDEVWVVSDFRDLASGIAEDLAAERTPLAQEIQERREHVQRVQADIAAREERIRLIEDETQAAKDEINGLLKKSRDDTQQIWDGEGAQIDGDYEAKLAQLKRAIADRAKSLNLKYEPDETYQSPEVWANAYRLALYEVPAGVDAVKEHQWLGDQMKQWRDFEKSLDDRKEQLREKAAAMKLEPAPKIADLNAKIEDLGQRIDATTAEEVPLKQELQQAQIDLGQAETADQGLDDKYYKQLDALPVENITKHIKLAPNGRFTWVEDEAFAEGESQRKYWIFSRAIRADGRQYWALGHVSIEKNHKLCLLIEPDSFISTKAILRPNLTPEEQEQ